MGLWNISQCVSYDVEENASGGKSGLYQRIYGDGSGRRTEMAEQVILTYQLKIKYKK